MSLRRNILIALLTVLVGAAAGVQWAVATTEASSEVLTLGVIEEASQDCDYRKCNFTETGCVTGENNCTATEEEVECPTGAPPGARCFQYDCNDPPCGPPV